MTVKTLDLKPFDVLIPRPNTQDVAGDTVSCVLYPPHNQLTNAAVVIYVRDDGEHHFLAGIETKHQIERP
jgi:hypothetical protein